MKKLLIIVLLLATSVAAGLAQIDTSKEYRIMNSDGTYMNVKNHDWYTGSCGGVNVAAWNGSESQIFTFVQSGDGYKVKCRDGYYIKCHEWNVNASTSNEDEASLLFFEETEEELQYLIKWVNTYKDDQTLYFKVGPDSKGSGNHPYGDAGKADAATWTLLPASINVIVLGTSDATAGVIYNKEEYKNGSTLNTIGAVEKDDFTAVPVSGMHAVINIDEANVYVSYFSNSTKFYTVKGHKVDLYYMSLNPDYCDGANLKLTNKNTPQDNRGLWMFEAQSDGGYKIYNYSTGLTKVLGITGNEANARASMVDRNSTSHSTVFDGTINFDGTASYIKIKGSNNNYWNKRGNYLALWAADGAVGDNGSTFFMEEADYTLFPDEYNFEYTPKNANTLWYKSSAKSGDSGNAWQEYALPLGNGELGCMVFGEVQSEEIQFNEKTLWSGPANTIGADNGKRTFVNFGSLFITDNNAQAAIDYVRYLDLEEGIAGVEFKKSNDTKQVRRYFSSAPDSVIVINYKNIGSEKLNLTFRLTPCSDIGASSVEYSDGTASFTGAMEAVEYAARVHIATDNGATVSTASDGITVSDATEVTFFLKGGTNFNGDMTVLNNYFTNETKDDVNNRIKADIEKAAAKEYAVLEKTHIDDFSAITKRMTFSLGLETPSVDTKELIDKYYPNNQAGNSTDNDHLFLEQLYFHYGRYLAISSNRKPIAAPNNLQGIWNNMGCQASQGVWNSDIHTNINVQMNYWPTEITNLSDLHKPFVNFIIRGAQSEGWKMVAQQYNDGYGWSVLTESSLYNSMSTWGSNYLVANVWYTSHLWMHWRYTQDKEFLKKAFPVMWDCAEFWFHRLIQDRKVYDGTYVAPDEFSAEQHGNEKEDGTAHAQQMISYLFQNLTDAVEILGAENTGLSQADLDKLALYLEKTDKGLHTETYDGAWGNPFNGVSTGEQLLREWKYSPYSVGERGHRHISHLMALFPMDQITPESEYFTPAVNALKHRGDAATGWSMGWKVNLWARAQDGDHAHIIIKNALQHAGSNGGVYYNLFDAHPPFQIDGNFGVCSGMAEMLLQSAHGYINILPALPKVWEKSGDVAGMKAMGNFTVDFNWADGKCQKATIVSNAGAELKVRCNRGAMEIGKALVTVNGKKATVVVENGIATIPCVKDDVVVIDFTTTADSYVESHELNMSEVGYATLYLGFDAAIPELKGEDSGVYTITSVGNGYAHMEIVTGTLPANTGVVVKADEGKYTFVQSSSSPENIDKGLLKGTLVREQITKEADKEYYILSNEYDQLGFYIAGNGADNGYFLNDSNKAYLVISKEMAQGSAGFRFDFGGTTDVNEVNTDEWKLETEICDLQGRKVIKPSKGVYIINGKKVVVK